MLMLKGRKKFAAVQNEASEQSLFSISPYSLIPSESTFTKREN
jgi:hypothetical protein